MTIEWRDAFRRYELLASVWPVADQRLLRHALFSSEPLPLFLRKLIPAAAALFSEPLRTQIELLRHIFGRAKNPFPSIDYVVLDDVYHAAIYFLWSQDNPNMYWYRGQRRDKWRVVPSLTQVVAVAQHYGVPTWLLDATRSPWVALYFASRGGVSDDIGIVRYIMKSDWRGLAERIEVNVPGVRRIQRQEAVFLEAPHPDFFEQLTSTEVRFRQKSEVTFESTVFGVGHDLLNDADPILSLSNMPRRSAPMSGYAFRTPGLKTISPLTIDDYFRVISVRCCWPDETDVHDNSVLRLACRLHSELQTSTPPLSAEKRSLYRLKRTLHQLLVIAHQILVARSLDRKLFLIQDFYEDVFADAYVAELVSVYRTQAGR